MPSCCPFYCHSSIYPSAHSTAILQPFYCSLDKAMAVCALASFLLQWALGRTLVASGPNKTRSFKPPTINSYIYHAGKGRAVVGFDDISVSNRQRPDVQILNCRDLSNVVRLKEWPLAEPCRLEGRETLSVA